MAQTGQQQQQQQSAAETAETELHAPTHLSSATSPQPADNGNGSGSSSSAIMENSTNSSLLLRLFTSQFFDSWLAVSYLFRYPQMVGAQHFLCNELRKFPIDEVEFFLPQLVHLLITRPNESIAVESLLMDMSLRSSHVAMLLYWYLQAYLSDLAPNPRTPSFKHCQRIFNQVQELLFTDIAPELIIDAPEPVQYSYLYAMEHGTSRVPRPSMMAGLAERFRAMFRLTPQVRENTAAAFVGIGSSLASPGAPSLAPTMGWLAVAQGQRVKISERIDEDSDLPPQHHLLTGKGKKGVGRSSSVMVRRTVDKDAEHGQRSVRHAYTGTNTPAAMDVFGKGSSQRALGVDDAERMSSSQPTTPSLSEHLSREFDDDDEVDGNNLDRTGWSATPELGQSNPEAAAAIVGPAQHAFLGSRAPTPGGRVSTDSCRTVAVMENVERTRPEGTQSKSRETASVRDKQGMLPRKQYLDKAAKEFQRNAKALGRKLGRQSPGMLSQASGMQRAHKVSRMRANMSDMATYMEGERKKLERRTGYFSAEIKFMTALMDIAQSVCAVPKVGRQQSLKAELTLLNHSLDRNMCIPLWCPDSDGAHHHRIVRIPTEDTVVLNSAERAPYLLTLEILEPDASTDCSHGASRSISADPRSDAVQTEAAHKDSPGPPSIAVDDLDDEPEVDITSLSIGRKFSGNIEATIAAKVASRIADEIADAPKEVGIPQLPVRLAPEPVAESAAAASSPQDVDEDLMAQVFGDLNDFSGSSGSGTPLNRQRNHTRPPSKSRSVETSHRSRHQQPHAAGSGHSRRLSSQPEQPQKHHRPSSLAIPKHTAPAPHLQPSGALSAQPSLVSRTPVSQEEIRARMRMASVLLAQLARQQKALGIKVTNLVVPQSAGGPGSADPAKGSDSTDTMRRRSKLSNPTSQALAMEEIREKLIHEMMQLEELRLSTAPEIASVPNSAATQDPSFAEHTVSAPGDSDIDIHAVEYKDDPSAKVLKEDWESKKARIRRASPFGRHRNWNLLSVIVKDGADLRQEQLALQLIREMQRIWQREKTDVFVQYYRIMVTGEGCGLMETITNTVSVHSIKKEFYSRNPDYAGLPYTLYNYFVTSFGTPDTDRFKKAQDNFMRSLVAYSLITYILQIRDRHNGNILLDTAGHIIHIDFGFMLSNSPGSVGFEMAPFKFPMEYVDILGGRESAKFQEFRELLVTAFLALRKYADNICLLVEMMVKDSPLPCLSGGQATVASLRDRLHLTLSDQQTEELVNGLLMSSCDNVTMRMYDSFQYYSNGIL